MRDIMLLTTLALMVGLALGGAPGQEGPRPEPEGPRPEPEGPECARAPGPGPIGQRGAPGSRPPPGCAPAPRDTCLYRGRTYRRGQSVPSRDFCTECRCDPDYREPRCRKQQCPRVRCQGGVRPRYPAPDACCPSCPRTTPTNPRTTTTTTTKRPDTCTFNGRTYRRGETISGRERCGYCWCDPSYPRPRCQAIRCSRLRCRGGAPPVRMAPDMCCPVCPESWLQPRPPGPPVGPGDRPPAGPGPQGQP